MRTEEALGPARVEFLSSLLPSHKIGNYVFVHAGIDPEQPLDEQEFADLVLFRHAFLDADADRKHSFCVVHGHSIASPTVKLHRIAVDAGY